MADGNVGFEKKDCQRVNRLIHENGPGSVVSEYSFAMFFPVFKGRLAGDLLKLLVKIGHVLEAAFIADVLHVVLRFHQHLMRIADAYLVDKAHDRLIRAVFEIAAERRCRHVCDIRDVIQLDVVAEVGHYVFQYAVETLHVERFNLAIEPDRREVREVFTVG